MEMPIVFLLLSHFCVRIQFPDVVFHSILIPISVYFLQIESFISLIAFIMEILAQWCWRNMNWHNTKARPLQSSDAYNKQIVRYLTVFHLCISERNIIDVSGIVYPATLSLESTFFVK